MRRKHDNNYLHFTKKERTGIFVLLCIIILFTGFPFFYETFFSNKANVNNKYVDDIALLKVKMIDSSGKKYNAYKKYDYVYPLNNKYSFPENNKGELFEFDPNTLSANGWKRLGLKEKTISNIQNYLIKGGKFREPGDIKKIWGLNPMLAERLLSYVKIGEVAENKDRTALYKNNYSKKTFQPVDINDGDSILFMTLPGIGPMLSKRIIKYRDKLGGFYSADQVAEAFGMPDSTYKKIRPFLNTGSATIKKLNINSATLEELKVHPYIRYHLANVIIQYRVQHGNYKFMADLKNIMLMNDSIYKKISPYLTLE